MAKEPECHNRQYEPPGVSARLPDGLPVDIEKSHIPVLMTGCGQKNETGNLAWLFRSRHFLFMFIVMSSIQTNDSIHALAGCSSGDKIYQHHASKLSLY